LEVTWGAVQSTPSPRFCPKVLRG